MKKLGWIIGTAAVTVIVLVIELMLISKASGHETTEKVVFAKVSIDENSVITRDMLEIREVASDLVLNSTARSIEEAESKVSAMRIEAGEMLLKSKLRDEDDNVIEVSDKSNRLFSIRFETDQANGWQLEEGQLVDLICIPDDDQQGQILTSNENGKIAADIPASAGEEEVSPIYEAAAVRVNEEQTDSEYSVKSAGSPVSISKALTDEYSSFTETTVLKGIRIAAIIGEDGRRQDNKEWEKPQYISFEVTEKQAVFLAYVKYNGKIELAGIPKQE